MMAQGNVMRIAGVAGPKAPTKTSVSLAQVQGDKTQMESRRRECFNGEDQVFREKAHFSYGKDPSRFQVSDENNDLTRFLVTIAKGKQRISRCGGTTRPQCRVIENDVRWSNSESILSGFADVEGTIKMHGRCQRQYHPPNQLIQVCVCPHLDAQRVAAQAVQRLFFDREDAVGVPDQPAIRKDAVVGPDDRFGQLWNPVDRELKLVLLVIIKQQTLERSDPKPATVPPPNEWKIWKPCIPVR
jgi:hypothetical protein